MNTKYHLKTMAGKLAAVVVLNGVFAGAALAATAGGTEKVIVNFDGSNGSAPAGSLVRVTNDLLYGVTRTGGVYGAGTAFTLTSKGVLTVLHSFMPGTEGTDPVTLMRASDGNFYGSTEANGGYPSTLFKMTPAGQVTTLHTIPLIGLGQNVFSTMVEGTDGNLYGVAVFDGQQDDYTFRMSFDGSFTVLDSNFDCEGPTGCDVSGLVLGPDGNFYGTVTYGGPYGFGFVYQMLPDGTMNDVYAFTGQGDGGRPQTALAFGADGNLYGTTTYGGAGSRGTVFKVTLQGALTTLQSFPNDGSFSFAPLFPASDGNLYGVSVYGGLYGHKPPAIGDGYIYRVSTDGQYTSLYNFVGGSRGALPSSALIETRPGVFYGSAEGGTSNDGLIYRFTAKQ